MSLDQGIKLNILDISTHYNQDVTVRTLLYINLFSKRHLIRSGITLKNNTDGCKNPHCYQHLQIDQYHSLTIGIYDDDDSYHHKSGSNKAFEDHISIKKGFYEHNEQCFDSNVSPYESVPSSKSKKHLTFRDLTDIVSKLFTACTKNPHLHVVVGDFMLQMSNAVEKIEFSKINSLNDLQSEFNRLIHNLNSSLNNIDMIKSFKQISLRFNPSLPNPYHTSRKRLVSIAEQNAKKFQTNIQAGAKEG